MLKNKRTNNEGFTLIELLIVVVIIGILAGILVTIIDPQRQQNRAKDAAIMATLNKLALAAEAYTASFGVAPGNADFLADVDLNANPKSVGECDASFASGLDCIFSVVGNDLPDLCTAADPVFGSGTAPCYFRYEKEGTADAVKTNFQIWVRASGLTTQMYRVSNTSAEIQKCNLDQTNCRSLDQP